MTDKVFKSKWMDDNVLQFPDIKKQRLDDIEEQYLELERQRKLIEEQHVLIQERIKQNEKSDS
jgi:hypothetical protein